MTDQARGRHAPATFSNTPSTRFTSWEAFWFVLGNIAFAAMYFAKLPFNKVMDEAGMLVMTPWARFWYVVGCIPFGQMYFIKVAAKRVILDIRP